MVGAGDCGADGAGRGIAELGNSARIYVGSRGDEDAISTFCATILPGMSTGVSVDEFQALEQKVLQAVEIVKREREARAAAEAEAKSLREKLAAQSAELQQKIDSAKSQARTAQSEKQAAESQVGALSQERDAVRQRVERLLHQMDELL